MAKSGYNSTGSVSDVIGVSDSEDDTQYKCTGTFGNPAKTVVKDFVTIINEVRPKAKNVVKLKFRKKEDGEFTILPNSCDQTQKIECKNHLQGCAKVDIPTSVRTHQLTCTFPPLKVSKDLVRTKGVLLRKMSLNSEGVAKFVPFCNSFLHHSGTQFIFKHFSTNLVIQAYSNQAQGKKFRMLLKGMEDGRSWSAEVRGILGDQRHTVGDVGDQKMFKFQIVLQT